MNTSNTLSNNEIKLITLLSHPKMGELKNGKGLNARLAGCGFVETCGRCFGSGKYSFNLMDGDKCYGCGGFRDQSPEDQPGADQGCD